MSDYLVTNTELTETADAIRAKTGDSAAIEWESGTGFADAVAAIPSGGGTNYFDTCTGISYLYQCDFTTGKPTVPEKIVLDLPACRIASLAFRQYIGDSRYNLGIKEVDITFYRPVVAQNMFMRNSSIQKITFPNGITLTSTYYGFLEDASAVKSVIGKIGFSAPQAYNSIYAFRAPILENIEFVENQIPFNARFDSTALTDASILSIANGLSESASAQTLTMPAAVKTRMDAMMGTVALDTTQTYHIFTQDIGGTVTLSDFITNTKGWTLA